MDARAIGRVVIGFNGLFLVPYGLGCFFAPELVTRVTGLELPSAAAVAEARAMYGGAAIGLGLLLTLGAFKARFLDAGLLAGLAFFGGLGLARLIAIGFGGDGAYNYVAVAWELGCAALLMHALRGAEDLDQAASGEA